VTFIERFRSSVRRSGICHFVLSKAPAGNHKSADPERNGRAARPDPPLTARKAGVARDLKDEAIYYRSLTLHKRPLLKPASFVPLPNRPYSTLPRRFQHVELREDWSLSPLPRGVWPCCQSAVRLLSTITHPPTKIYSQALT
jgi:hypothetical protein